MDIKLTVTGDYSTSLLCFSPSDANCDTQEQPIKNLNDKIIIIWIIREKFEGDDMKLYIKTICKEKSADYIIKVEGRLTTQFGLIVCIHIISIDIIQKCFLKLWEKRILEF